MLERTYIHFFIIMEIAPGRCNLHPEYSELVFDRKTHQSVKLQLSETWLA